MKAAAALALALAACGGGGGGGGGGGVAAPASAAGANVPLVTTQETQCVAAGWQRRLVGAAGLQRLVLWKAPAAGWSRGAIVVFHGGGGQATNFCVANVALTQPQVRFTDLALAQGYAVFVADSSDRVTDKAGRLCGKIWDDEVRGRDSLDLPFVDALIRQHIAALRPAGSRSEVFLTGLSSGGYMAVRAATALPAQVTAFAPVSSGDPYGWTRDCTPRAGDRVNVFGVALDNETGRNISEPGACSASSYPNEMNWPSSTMRPPWRAFHHAQDGIHDLSCVDKLQTQLRERGYPGPAAFRLDGGARLADWHYWLDDYNQPLLDFFAAQSR